VRLPAPALLPAREFRRPVAVKPTVLQVTIHSQPVFLSEFVFSRSAVQLTLRLSDFSLQKMVSLVRPVPNQLDLLICQTQNFLFNKRKDLSN